jgi:glycosyltransferase involved in cell wall biosynthesis
LSSSARESGVAVTISADPEGGDEAATLDAAAPFVFASRPYDGGGHAIRAAMAAGQVVIAPDLPVANECIGHLASGVIYDLGRPLDLPRLSPEDVVRMSGAARARAALARTHWEADTERFSSYLADDGRRWSAGDGSASFLNQSRRRAHERAVVGRGK